MTLVDQTLYTVRCVRKDRRTFIAIGEHGGPALYANYGLCRQFARELKSHLPFGTKCTVIKVRCYLEAA